MKKTLTAITLMVAALTTTGTTNASAIPGATEFCVNNSPDNPLTPAILDLASCSGSTSGWREC